MKNFWRMNGSFLALGIFLVIGCGQAKPHTEYPADNSGLNIRDDKKHGLPTPLDQKENDADLSITQKIRQSIMADNSLSVDAKNVKVMSINGMVTLRGPVSSQNEKEIIERKAKAVAGDSKVDCQLEVKKQ